jgi:tRNA-specific 2-thiouridylase
MSDIANFDSGLNTLGLAKPPAETRVVVAMSGGVDSSVVAAMLKSEGYQVIGITLQLYDHGAAVHKKGACCAGQDIRDARDVAARIDIPHYVLDYEERFREKVIAPFAASYRAGETPIPCVSCNAQIKFKDLFETALDLGADILATGHYVASRDDGRGGRDLLRAMDSARDQSYFLFATTKAQLKLLRFPLGHLEKPAVRALARQHGLDVAEKHDSQDICFVPTGKYSDLVAKISPEAPRPGDIVHIDGRVLGTHAGIIHFTIGQRRGLGLGNVTGEVLHVVRIDAAQARVIVGPREALATRRILLREVNWLGGSALTDMPAAGLELAVRVRSTRPPVPARLHAAEDRIWVELSHDEDGISPGQACVFYASCEPQAQVLGGGFIVAAEAALQGTSGLCLPELTPVEL